MWPSCSHVTDPRVTDEEVDEDRNDTGDGLDDAVVEDRGRVIPTIHGSRERRRNDFDIGRYHTGDDPEPDTYQGRGDVKLRDDNMVGWKGDRWRRGKDKPSCSFWLIIPA